MADHLTPSGGYVHIPPKVHRCWLPDRNGPERPPVGAIWLCYECGTYWKFRYTDDSWGPVWDPLFWRNFWKRLELGRG